MAHIATRIAETAVIETGQRVILIKGVHEFHAGFNIQHNQGHLQAFGNSIGQHGLARARLSFQQQRHFQGHGDVDDSGQFIIQDIFRCPSKWIHRVFWIHKDSCSLLKSCYFGTLKKIHFIRACPFNQYRKNYPLFFKELTPTV